MGVPGRRERKKAATRQALADAALRLFLERGYDAVTVSEVADAADVSVTTLFNHFPGGKPALVFDEEDDRETALIGAVRDRAPGEPVLGALRAHLRASSAIHPVDHRDLARFRALVSGTPELAEHARATWARYEESLAAAIVDTTEGADLFDARVLARFVVEGLSLANRQPEPAAALDRVIDLLARGWDPG